MEGNEHAAAVDALCASCLWYRGRRIDPEMAAAAERAGLLPRGHCLRFPEIVPKHDGDTCGEHSFLAQMRAKKLAEDIAVTIAHSRVKGKA